ncbi:unnamed protein product [Oikopleura dioica]|uniref:Uncharacterized protein n=1 Tax=Oikopleura dioica TaxID=34765 RepID=E4XSN0_OIKDI|nr:unnamed protein product [Oikopleura dioica]CBY38528.1 unnamed protein product [Oikopleura dioica]CBY42125.1 unnamed protein product [Oikopleura dioica]
MSTSSFEVLLNEPSRSPPESLLSPRTPVDPAKVMMRHEKKLTQADGRRKSQIESVVQKQQKHLEHAEKVRAKAQELKKNSTSS